MHHTTSTTTYAPTEWFKSSFSSPSQSCVEVKFDGAIVHVRDSKYRRNPANDATQEPIITVAADQWTVFLDELTGHVAEGANGALSAKTTLEGTTLLCANESGPSLSYTQREWEMFLAGVRAHEFDCRPFVASLVDLVS